MIPGALPHPPAGDEGKWFEILVKDDPIAASIDVAFWEWLPGFTDGRTESAEIIQARREAFMAGAVMQGRECDKCQKLIDR